MTTIFRLLSFLITLFTIQFTVAQVDVQRVRIDFENPQGYTRHLLLGFTPDNSASDNFDYGYDALCPEYLDNDLNWMIEDQRYVTQGVGEFNANKYYPLGMFMSDEGEINISLVALENFEDDIDVYLYDLEVDSYTLLNAVDYIQNLEAETYLDRFFITFSSTAHLDIMANSVLSVNENEKDDVKIWFSKANAELSIKADLKNNAVISLYSLEGKKIMQEPIQSNEHKIDASNFSSGVYILKIFSSEYSYSSKVCITI